MQDGQGEGSCLAGAGLGNAQKVLAMHHAGNGLGLDRGGCVIAFGTKRLQQGFVEAEVGKLSQNESFECARPPDAKTVRRGAGAFGKRPA